MPTEKRLLGVDGVKQIAAEVYGIIAAHNTGENSHDNLKTRISDLENSIDSFATEDYVDNAVDEIDVLTEAEISEICGSTVGNLTLVDQDAVAEQVVDTLMDEIDFLTKEEISEICGSTVGDLTIVDQDAIAEQVIDTLMEELPTNQALVDNVAEKVPLVKVAEQPTFVDSKEEMTDTDKPYVLTTDGRIYTYKKLDSDAKIPNFTNLADQTSADWLTDKRINSSGVLKGAAGWDMTNYIPVTDTSILHVKGFDVMTAGPGNNNYGRIYAYGSNKEYAGYLQPNTSTMSGFFTAADYDADVCVIDWPGAKSKEYSTGLNEKEVAYIRLGGVTTADDIIITVDENITYELGSTPLFTDLTKQSEWTWTENNRTNSSGGFTEDEGSCGGYYIPCGVGDLIYIRGLKLKTSYSDTLNVQFFNSSMGFMFTGSTAYLRNTGIITEDGDYTVIQAGKTSTDGTSVTENTNTAYMRFSGMPLNGYTIDDVIITVNEEIAYADGYVWCDTGIVYNQPADYEDRVIALETDVKNNTGNIVMLQQRVKNLESGEVETVIPDWWEDEVADTIAKIKALQVGRNCVTFPFFSDNHQRLGYSGMLIKRVMDECHIPYCFYGGDSISSGYIDSEATMIAQDKAFDTMMAVVPNGRFCRTVGNHDGYWAVSSTENYTYTRGQVYELFLREESILQDKHFGDDGTYYYVDDIASKVRWIVVNTNGGSVDTAQIAWIQDAALSFDESGWAVVFVSHQPISNHYHANISNAEEVRAVVQSYINGDATNKADVVGWWSGHIHKDRIYTGAATNTADDTQGEAMGFTQVTITSDHTGIAYDDATKHTVANDDQSHAIDFVTINKGTRTVNITRLGIGDDRSYTY